MAKLRREKMRILQRVRMLPPAAQDAFFTWSFEQDRRKANAMLWGMTTAVVIGIGLSIYMVVMG
jgi:hypothetical protein